MCVCAHSEYIGRVWDHGRLEEQEGRDEREKVTLELIVHIDSYLRERQTDSCIAITGNGASVVLTGAQATLRVAVINIMTIASTPLCACVCVWLDGV